MRTVFSLLKISTPQIFNNRIPSTSHIIWFDLKEKAGSNRFGNPLLQGAVDRSTETDKNVKKYLNILLLVNEFCVL